MKIQWKTPPEHRNTGRPTGSKYAAVADALLAKPGKWALVGDYKTRASVGYIKARFREYGNFQVTSRARDDGRVEIYARAVSA